MHHQTPKGIAIQQRQQETAGKVVSDFLNFILSLVDKEFQANSWTRHNIWEKDRNLLKKMILDTINKHREDNKEWKIMLNNQGGARILSDNLNIFAHLLTLKIFNRHMKDQALATIISEYEKQIADSNVSFDYPKLQTAFPIADANPVENKEAQEEKRPPITTQKSTLTKPPTPRAKENKKAEEGQLVLSLLNSVFTEIVAQLESKSAEEFFGSNPKKLQASISDAILTTLMTEKFKKHAVWANRIRTTQQTTYAPLLTVKIFNQRLNNPALTKMISDCEAKILAQATCDLGTPYKLMNKEIIKRKEVERKARQNEEALRKQKEQEEKRAAEAMAVKPETLLEKIHKLHKRIASTAITANNLAQAKSAIQQLRADLEELRAEPLETDSSQSVILRELAFTEKMLTDKNNLLQEKEATREKEKQARNEVTQKLQQLKDKINEKTQSTVTAISSTTIKISPEEHNRHKAALNDEADSLKRLQVDIQRQLPKVAEKKYAAGDEATIITEKMETEEPESGTEAKREEKDNTDDKIRDDLSLVTEELSDANSAIDAALTAQDDAWEKENTALKKKIEDLDAAIAKHNDFLREIKDVEDDVVNKTTKAIAEINKTKDEIKQEAYSTAFDEDKHVLNVISDKIQNPEEKRPEIIRNFLPVSDALQAANINIKKSEAQIASAITEHNKQRGELKKQLLHQIEDIKNKTAERKAEALASINRDQNTIDPNSPHYNNVFADKHKSLKDLAEVVQDQFPTDPMLPRALEAATKGIVDSQQAITKAIDDHNNQRQKLKEELHNEITRFQTPIQGKKNNAIQEVVRTPNEFDPQHLNNILLSEISALKDLENQVKNGKYTPLQNDLPLIGRLQSAIKEAEEAQRAVNEAIDDHNKKILKCELAKELQQLSDAIANKTTATLQEIDKANDSKSLDEHKSPLEGEFVALQKLNAAFVNGRYAKINKDPDSKLHLHKVNAQHESAQKVIEEALDLKKKPLAYLERIKTIDQSIRPTYEGVQKSISETKDEILNPTYQDTFITQKRDLEKIPAEAARDHDAAKINAAIKDAFEKVQQKIQKADEAIAADVLKHNKNYLKDAIQQLIQDIKKPFPEGAVSEVNKQLGEQKPDKIDQNYLIDKSDLLFPGSNLKQRLPQLEETAKRLKIPMDPVYRELQNRAGQLKNGINKQRALKNEILDKIQKARQAIKDKLAENIHQIQNTKEEIPLGSKDNLFKDELAKLAEIEITITKNNQFKNDNEPAQALASARKDAAEAQKAITDALDLKMKIFGFLERITKLQQDILKKTDATCAQIEEAKLEIKPEDYNNALHDEQQAFQKLTADIRDSQIKDDVLLNQKLPNLGKLLEVSQEAILDAIARKNRALLEEDIQNFAEALNNPFPEGAVFKINKDLGLAGPETIKPDYLIKKSAIVFGVPDLNNQLATLRATAERCKIPETVLEPITNVIDTQKDMLIAAVKAQRDHSFAIMQLADILNTPLSPEKISNFNKQLGEKKPETITSGDLITQSAILFKIDNLQDQLDSLLHKTEQLKMPPAETMRVIKEALENQTAKLIAALNAERAALKDKIRGQMRDVQQAIEARKVDVITQIKRTPDAIELAAVANVFDDNFRALKDLEKDLQRSSLKTDPDLNKLLQESFEAKDEAQREVNDEVKLHNNKIQELRDQLIHQLDQTNENINTQTIEAIKAIENTNIPKSLDEYKNFLETEFGELIALKNDVLSGRYSQFKNDQVLPPYLEQTIERCVAAQTEVANALNQKKQLFAADDLILLLTPEDKRSDPRKALLKSDQLTLEQISALTKTTSVAHALPAPINAAAAKEPTLTTVWITNRDPEGKTAYNSDDKQFEGITLFLKYCDKKPDPTSTIVLAGRWDIHTLTQTIDCCHATGRPFTFGENFKVVLGKNADGNEIGEKKQGSNWVSAVKKAGDWVATRKNVFDAQAVNMLVAAKHAEAEMAVKIQSKQPIAIQTDSLKRVYDSYNHLMSISLYADQLNNLMQNVLHHKLANFKPVVSKGPYASGLFQQPPSPQAPGMPASRHHLGHNKI